MPPAKTKAIAVPGAKKIQVKDLPIFTRQFAAMLDSGMPLVQCMLALEEQTENVAFQKVLTDVRTRVEGGAMYSEALEAYPTIFDELYVSMMRAGEMGGILAEVSDRVAGFLESSNKLRGKVKSAMMYPTVVIIVAMILATALVMFVLPVFAEMFSGFGGGLPAPTQALLDFSDWLRGNALIVTIIIAAAVFGFKKYAKTEKGAIEIDRFKLNFPSLGQLATKVAISRFASTFAQLLSSGVPIIQALDIVCVATGNKVIGGAILEAKEAVKQGQPLSSSLSGNKYYPRIVIHMLASGEKTGKIDVMMQKLSDFYEDEVETMLDGLTSMIEPLLMVFVGIVIGGVVLCMFLPIFKMSEVVM